MRTDQLRASLVDWLDSVGEVQTRLTETPDGTEEKFKWGHRELPSGFQDMPVGDIVAILRSFTEDGNATVTEHVCSHDSGAYDVVYRRVQFVG